MNKLSFADYQFAAIYNPFDHFVMYGGVGLGKSRTGAFFALKMINEYPKLSGFIAANSYDQLAQVTLRLLFAEFDEHGVEYVFDRRPPKEWRSQKTFKSYKNIISVRHNDQVITIYVRVLSDPDNIRGMEFSWYWIDELRDTSEYAHDMVLGRMRESDIQKGLLTTTTNGESWDYHRFVKGNLRGDKTFGSMHVASIESVKRGFISQKYYDTLRRTYSPMMALQELDAQHVNIFGGKAYYSAGPHNMMRRAPWGDAQPNREYPLIVGCDFNFSPAPCAWVVGQIGPSQARDGKDYSEHIHWFGELSEVEISTPEMTRRLVSRWPDFHYKIYGDMSGNVGTTSNAGRTDFNQISQELSDMGCLYTVDAIQFKEEILKRNPFVKDRIECMNSRLKNAMGEVNMTYDPVGCPLLAGDMRMVGWRKTANSSRGKLDDGGDKLRTHASDAAGYAVYRLFPPRRRGYISKGVVSSIRAEHGLDDI